MREASAAACEAVRGRKWKMRYRTVGVKHLGFITSNRKPKSMLGKRKHNQICKFSCHTCIAASWKK